MKNILFLLLLICIKINAYEYLIYSKEEAIGSNAKYVIYYDDDGLKIKRITGDGVVYDNYQSYFYNNLNSIKYNSGNGYISKNTFDSYFKEDLNFLNDLYKTSSYIRIGFLNYLYNDSYFGQQSFINYENYELLYDKNGLVVESIINGVWAGLYDDANKDRSGYLISSENVVYYNGEPANLFMSLSYHVVPNITTTLLDVGKMQPKILLIFIASVFAFTILFWVIYHCYNGITYLMDIGKKYGWREKQ